MMRWNSQLREWETLPQGCPRQSPTIPAPFSPAEREMAAELGGKRWGSGRMKIVRVPE
jgi:hypothetical protein